jgi:hypothetical protein
MARPDPIKMAANGPIENKDLYFVTTNLPIHVTSGDEIGCRVVNALQCRYNAQVIEFHPVKLDLKLAFVGNDDPLEHLDRRGADGDQIPQHPISIDSAIFFNIIEDSIQSNKIAMDI